jgi:hypothetical protein
MLIYFQFQKFILFQVCKPLTDKDPVDEDLSFERTLQTQRTPKIFLYRHVLRATLYYVWII